MSAEKREREPGSEESAKKKAHVLDALRFMNRLLVPAELPFSGRMAEQVTDQFLQYWEECDDDDFRFQLVLAVVRSLYLDKETPAYKYSQFVYDRAQASDKLAAKIQDWINKHLHDSVAVARFIDPVYRNFGVHLDSITSEELLERREALARYLQVVLPFADLRCNYKVLLRHIQHCSDLPPTDVSFDKLIHGVHDPSKIAGYLHPRDSPTHLLLEGNEHDHFAGPKLIWFGVDVDAKEYPHVLTERVKKTPQNHYGATVLVFDAEAVWAAFRSRPEYVRHFSLGTRVFKQEHSHATLVAADDGTGRFPFGAGLVDAGVDRPTRVRMAPCVASGDYETYDHPEFAFAPPRGNLMIPLKSVQVRFRPHVFCPKGKRGNGCLHDMTAEETRSVVVRELRKSFGHDIFQLLQFEIPLKPGECPA